MYLNLYYNIANRDGIHIMHIMAPPKKRKPAAKKSTPQYILFYDTGIFLARSGSRATGEKNSGIEERDSRKARHMD